MRVKALKVHLGGREQLLQRKWEAGGSDGGGEAVAVVV